MDIKHGEYFNDIDHLNDKGAGMFTRTLWSVVNDHDEDSADGKFYDTYEEKLENEQPEIYGLYYYKKDRRDDEQEDDGSPVYSTGVYSVASSMNDAKYRISRTVWGSDDVEVVRDYDESRTFELPTNQGGIVTVEALRGEEYYKMEVEY